jgi:predicted kinase
MPKQECNTPGCRNLTERRYCPGCSTEKHTEYRSREERKARHRFYDSKAWKACREETLELQPECVCTLEQCPHEGACGMPTEVIDHIISREPCRGGNQETHHAYCDLCDDPTNRQGLCVPCHNTKTRIEKGTMTGAKVTVVSGPPGAGKTTYVLQRFKPGDLLIDFDQIMRGLSGLKHNYPSGLLPFGWEARDAVLKKLEGCKNVERAWVIDCAPTRERRDRLRQRFNAKVVVLETPAAVCIQRIRGSEARGEVISWDTLVRDWWSRYEPSPRDERVFA